MDVIILLVIRENLNILVYQYYSWCKWGQKENWKALKLLSVRSERTCFVRVIYIKCMEVLDISVIALLLHGW